MKSKWVKILVIGLVSMVLLAAGAYGAYRGYKSWRQQRFVTQAKEFIEAGQDRKASISLQRAIRAKPSDVEALRLMAGLAEKERSPAALVLRQRVVELSPDTVNDRLALAQAAMVFQDMAVATNALAGVAPADRGTVEFQNVAGGVASVMGRVTEAEQYFEEASRLDPNNPFIRLNLAVVRLQGTNTQDLVLAQKALEEITTGSTNSGLRVRAYRELIGHSLRTGATNAAIPLANAMVAEPDVEFRDRLLRLDVLGINRYSNFVAELEATRALSTNEIGMVNQLVLWQMTKIPPRPNLEWIASLPEDYRTNSAVSLMTSDLRVAVGDWQGIEDALSTQNWGPMEFMRHAFRTLAMRQLGLTGAADIEWGLCMRATGAERVALNMLLQAVARWGWPDEMREILSTMVSRYPAEKWAAELLTQNLFSEGRTRSLMSLFSTQLSADPDNLAIKNNLAMTAMLLEANELRPFEMARQVYEASPTNAAYASTYAYALHRQAKDAEALAVFEKLTAEQRAEPSIAGYYAMMLRANGRGEEAKRYFDLAAEARMLPEERKVIDEARAGL